MPSESSLPRRRNIIPLRDRALRRVRSDQWRLPIRRNDEGPVARILAIVEEDGRQWARIAEVLVEAHALGLEKLARSGWGLVARCKCDVAGRAVVVPRHAVACLGVDDLNIVERVAVGVAVLGAALGHVVRVQL